MQRFGAMVALGLLAAVVALVCSGVTPVAAHAQPHAHVWPVSTRTKPSSWSLATQLPISSFPPAEPLTAAQYEPFTRWNALETPREWTERDGPQWLHWIQQQSTAADLRWMRGATPAPRRGSTLPMSRVRGTPQGESSLATLGLARRSTAPLSYNAIAKRAKSGYRATGPVPELSAAPRSGFLVDNSTSLPRTGDGVAALSEWVPRLGATPPPGYAWPPAGCPWSMINCLNGGYFNASDCIFELDVPAGVDDWAAVTTCVCPDGWRGVDCGLAVGPATCAAIDPSKNQSVFDNSWVNAIAPKQIECFLVEATSTLFPLQDHHVNLTIDLPNGRASFVMASRVRQTPGVWDNVIPEVWCDLSQCSGVTQPDDPNFQVYYTCLQVNCSACGADQGCSAIVQWFVNQIGPPINAGFYNLQNNASSAQLRLMTAIFNLDLVCQTGSCEGQAAVQNVVGYTSYAWVIIAVVAGGVASCVGLTGAAVHSNRPRKALRGRETGGKPKPGARKADGSKPLLSSKPSSNGIGATTPLAADVDQSIFDDSLVNGGNTTTGGGAAGAAAAAAAAIVGGVGAEGGDEKSAVPALVNGAATSNPIALPTPPGGMKGSAGHGSGDHEHADEEHEGLLTVDSTPKPLAAPIEALAASGPGAAAAAAAAAAGAAAPATATTAMAGEPTLPHQPREARLQEGASESEQPGLRSSATDAAAGGPSLAAGLPTKPSALAPPAYDSIATPLTTPGTTPAPFFAASAGAVGASAGGGGKLERDSRSGSMSSVLTSNSRLGDRAAGSKAAATRGGPMALRPVIAAGPVLGGGNSNAMDEFASMERKELALYFRDVSYEIPDRRCCGTLATGKRILKPTSGIVRAGEVMALMGASGAGKTTLLDIVARTGKVGRVSGRVALAVNGREVLSNRDGEFPDFVAYLSSEDTLLATQTVYETVQFSARLRCTIPKAAENDPEEYLHRKVETVLQDLGLLHVADTRVGNAAAGGISSGERKRLSLAVELVTDPLLLFADEPTSGLDSYNANLLMTVLKRHARVRGLAVIASIHQPPANTWHTFDQVLLLTRRGEMAFCGPTAGVIAYMSAVTGETCPPRANPAEFLLDLASSHKYTHLMDSFRKSPEHTALMTAIGGAEAELVRRAGVGAIGPLVVRQGEVKTWFLRQAILLSARSFNHIARDPSLLLLTMAFTLLAAVVLGIVFYQISNDLSGSQDRAGFLFFLVFFFTLLSLNSLNLFLAERRVYVKESSSLYYSAGAFLLSKILVDIFPLRVIPPLLFGCISYWMIGLQPDPFHFVTFLVIVVMVNVVAVSACFAISTVSRSEAQANLLAVVFFVFCMLFGGLFVNFHAPGTIIDYIKPLRFASFFHYGYCALMINEFKNLNLLFDPIGGSTAEINGQTFLNNLSLDTDSFGTDVGALGGMVALFQFIAYLSLKFGTRSFR